MLRLVARLVQTRGETAGEQMSPYPDERSAMLLYRRPAPSFGRSALSALGRGLQEPSWRSVCFKERLSYRGTGGVTWRTRPASATRRSKRTRSAGSRSSTFGASWTPPRAAVSRSVCWRLRSPRIRGSSSTSSTSLTRRPLRSVSSSRSTRTWRRAAARWRSSAASRTWGDCCTPLACTLNLFDTVESAVEHLRALG